jgi:hypothetical protein
MATEGYTSPSRVENDDSIGTSLWESETNDGTTAADLTAATQSSNNVDAATVSAIGASDPSVYLYSSQYHFGIPAGATITGVELQYECYGSTASKDNSIKLVLGGGSYAGSDENATTGMWAAGGDSAQTRGTSSDLWGFSATTQLTPTTVNSPKFGSVISAGLLGGSPTPRIDHIQMKIHYTASTNFVASTGMSYWIGRGAIKNTSLKIGVHIGGSL